MSRTVTALYDTLEEAEHALRVLTAQVPVVHADAFDRSSESIEKLQALDLSQEERVACRLKLASGGFLLLAQVEDDEDPQAIVSVLEQISEGDEPAPSAAPPQRIAGANEDVSAAAEPPPAAVGQAPPPSADEAVRVGDRELVRGGATVHSREQALPTLGEVELLEELVRVETRPAARLVSDDELEQAGLLRDRVIEIAQVREEPVIEKEAFVREEVVVTKAVERRVEQVHADVPHNRAERKDDGPDRAGRREADGLETLEGQYGRS